MKRAFANLRARVLTPPLQLELPARIAQRLAVGLDLMQGAELEAWWDAVWRDRGLPDPVTVTAAQFKEAVKARRESE